MGILHTNMLFITVYDCSLCSYDVIVTSTYQKSAKIHCNLKKKTQQNSKFRVKSLEKLIL